MARLPDLLDRITVNVVAGAGGNGCVSFRREKFVPFGGPDGGNGGDGGSVILLADRGVRDLRQFFFKPIHKAVKGGQGKGKKMTGAVGKDLILKVPCGTVVFDPETGVQLADLEENGSRWIAAKGGNGGRGNASFKTSRDRAPRKVESGGAGEERALRLELKLVADVGLVGPPNVGKSTLLGRLTPAISKTATYPFTTLSPHLGILIDDEYESTVIADIPGLIEGAHEGKGLGLDFLRHVERCRVLVILLDASTTEVPLKQAKNLLGELESYGHGVTDKPMIIAVNKIDVVNDADLQSEVSEYLNRPVLALSAKTGEGVDKIKGMIEKILSDTKEVQS